MVNTETGGIRYKSGGRHPELLKRLCHISAMMGKDYKENVLSVVLYGSYVRGQENAESDIDMAVFLKNKLSKDQYDQITDWLVDFELEQGVTLSLIQIEEKDFSEWKTTLPFYKNIEKEGIVLCKSA